MPLVSRLQPHDSIAQFEEAARQRYQEASLLHFGRRPYAAIYLYGYAIELWLKAAYFHNEGLVGLADPIREAERNRAWQQRAAAGVAPGRTNQHDLNAWVSLLIHIRRTTGIYPPYVPLVESTLRRYAGVAYDNWRVEMRYQHDANVLTAEIDAVREVADWFAANFISL